MTFYANFTGVNNTHTVRGLDGSNFGDVGGYTTSPGNISGSGKVHSFEVSGTLYDLTLAMLAASHPQQSAALPTTTSRRG